jgi:hypothetical protein
MQSPAVTIVSADHPITDRIGGASLGPFPLIAPVFHGDEAAGGFDVLGRYTGSGRAALIARDFGDWKSVFCGAPRLSVPLLRNLAGYAGVPLLVDPDDPFADDAITANDDAVFVYAIGEGGRRTFHAPGGAERSVDVHDAATGALVAGNVTQWSDHLEANEQKTYRITPHQPPFDPADVNRDRRIDAIDVQLVINAALGFDIAPWEGDINTDDRIDAIDVQLVINAVLGV